MHEREWTDTPLDIGASVSLGSTTLQRCAPPRAAFLISGELDAALAAVCPNAPRLGLLEGSSGAKDFAIRIGRFSALLVLNSSDGPKPGWTDAGYGVSDARDAYTEFRLDGEAAPWILSQGGIAELDAASPSASVLFAGVSALLIREASAFSLWIPQAYATYMTTFLKGAHTDPL